MEMTEFEKKVLAGVDALTSENKSLKTVVETQGADIIKMKQSLNEQAEASARMGKMRVLRARADGLVSDECAAHVAAITIAGALGSGRLSLESTRKARLMDVCKGVLGSDVTKTALTSSDIPLPTQYGSEVVELVSQYGAARRFGTVFPLGTGSVSLPRLKTDTTFGLLTQSAAVTEKSPQFEWVAFNAKKWGGLVRIPSEIDADSIVPMGQFISRYCARNLARIEDALFFVGDGTATYDSLSGLAFSTITNSKVVQMGAGKTSYDKGTLANFRSIRATVDAPIIGRGAYYMHPSMEQLLNSFNASGDKPYQAAGTNGATLDGFPVRWVDVMPAYSTSANVSKVFALFGDASYQYLGVCGGVSIESSMEAGFTTDEILVRGMERFTIGLMAVGAMAGLETAAS